MWLAKLEVPSFPTKFWLGGVDSNSQGNPLRDVLTIVAMRFNGFNPCSRRFHGSCMLQVRSELLDKVTLRKIIGIHRREGRCRWGWSHNDVVFVLVSMNIHDIIKQHRNQKNFIGRCSKAKSYSLNSEYKCIYRHILVL